MPQDGRELFPNSGHGPFVSGIVLGLSVGLVAGHLVLFAPRGAEPDWDADAEVVLSADPSIDLFPVPDVSVDEERLLTTLEFDGQEDVGRVRLSDQAPQEHLHFFPEAIHAGDSFVEEHADATAGDEPSGSGPLRMTAEVTHTSDPPPKPLQPPPAAPIDQRTSEKQRIARSIIAGELPDATPQEHEIWCEVLQGLPAEDIKGILRMRKHIGPREPSALSALLSVPTAEVPRPDQAPTATAADATEPVAMQLDRITGYNRDNRDTVAYKRLVPVTAEAAPEDEPGIQLCRVIRDMSQGELQPTERLLDLAISGCGFLQVRCGDKVRYTRDGRLTLDEAGRLMMLAASERWHLDPPLTIPATAIDIAIDQSGEVQVVLQDRTESPVGRIPIVHFVNPQALQHEGGGLYQAVPGAGAPCVVNGEGQPLETKLVQFHVERSNVSAPVQEPSSFSSASAASK